MEKDDQQPPLLLKITSALKWGAIGGFIGTVAYGIASVTSKNSKSWKMINEWLIGTTGIGAAAGIGFGWNKRQVEYSEQKSEALQAENSVLKTELATNKSWVATENNRPQQAASDINR